MHVELDLQLEKKITSLQDNYITKTGSVPARVSSIEKTKEKWSVENVKATTEWMCVWFLQRNVMKNR